MVLRHCGAVLRGAGDWDGGRLNRRKRPPTETTTAATGGSGEETSD